MGYDIPDTEPTEFTAGDSWQWDKVLSDYPPSDGWQLTYLFRGAKDYDAAWNDDVKAASGDESYEIRIPKTDTDLTAGTYRLIGYVENDTERHIVHDDDAVTVWANPTTAVGQGTHAERSLAIIEAAIEGRLTDDEEEWEINGRSVKAIPIDELYRLRNHYRQEVHAERNPEHPFQSVEAHFHAP